MQRLVAELEDKEPRNSLLLAANADLLAAACLPFLSSSSSSSSSAPFPASSPSSPSSSQSKEQGIGRSLERLAEGALKEVEEPGLRASLLCVLASILRATYAIQGLSRGCRARAFASNAQTLCRLQESYLFITFTKSRPLHSHACPRFNMSSRHWEGSETMKEINELSMAPVSGGARTVSVSVSFRFLSFFCNGSGRAADAAGAFRSASETDPTNGDALRGMLLAQVAGTERPRLGGQKKEEQ